MVNHLFKIKGNFTGILDGTLEVLSDIEERVEVMFLTHAPFEHLDKLQKYFIDKRFDVCNINYCFLDFDKWGNYFNTKSGVDYINTHLEYFKGFGFENILYFDITECHKDLKDKWKDSILEESNDWWTLLTLDPNKSWFNYLKNGMIKTLETYGDNIIGFAVDRIDRCRDQQELDYATRLLDEVREESNREVKYVFNSLQEWQSSICDRALFIGTDGAYVIDNLESEINKFRNLSQRTELNKFYLVADPTDAEDYKKLLTRHRFTFIDDYLLDLIDNIF